MGLFLYIRFVILTMLDNSTLPKNKKQGEKFMNEFEKIIGYESIKFELERICDVLKNFDKYQQEFCFTAMQVLAKH